MLTHWYDFSLTGAWRRLFFKRHKLQWPSVKAPFLQTARAAKYMHLTHDFEWFPHPLKHSSTPILSFLKKHFALHDKTYQSCDVWSLVIYLLHFCKAAYPISRLLSHHSRETLQHNLVAHTSYAPFLCTGFHNQTPKTVLLGFAVYKGHVSPAQGPHNIRLHP